MIDLFAKVERLKQDLKDLEAKHDPKVPVPLTQFENHYNVKMVHGANGMVDVSPKSHSPEHMKAYGDFLDIMHQVAVEMLRGAP